MDSENEKLSNIRNDLFNIISKLTKINSQDEVEEVLKDNFNKIPENLTPDTNQYYDLLNYYLYKFCLKHYKIGEDNICMWRFFKKISDDQLYLNYPENSNLEMMDLLIRTYYYSAPLDDLTCIFIPINNAELINPYLKWIKNYFYDANYPTSLLWLYALDSLLISLFPDEMFFIGKSIKSTEENIMIPDFDYKDSIFIRRYTNKPDHYIKLEGINANNEFRQQFDFLQNEYHERCLSHSGKHDESINDEQYKREWEKFAEVLEFGVSDKSESGCVSFSDLRSSTSFLNTYGKNIFRNKIQQPFFEETKLISNKYKGRIDKFMGDNVMCVFLKDSLRSIARDKRDDESVINNFFAVFNLCESLYRILEKNGMEKSSLGLRSGVSYGEQILRSNLGNEIVRDFTVTGETVNLAARLEHISINELILHNNDYFSSCIKRFPEIYSILSIKGNYDNLSPETKLIIRDYTLYQNIISNLERLEKIRFDIRMNQYFYLILKNHLQNKGYLFTNKERSLTYGYEEFEVEGFSMRFYYSYYNPKGFSRYEKIWILPLTKDLLNDLDINKLK